MTSALTCTCHTTLTERVTYLISVMWFEIKTWWKVKNKNKKTCTCSLCSWSWPFFVKQPGSLSASCETQLHLVLFWLAKFQSMSAVCRSQNQQENMMDRLHSVLTCSVQHSHQWTHGASPPDSLGHSGDSHRLAPALCEHCCGLVSDHLRWWICVP